MFGAAHAATIEDLAALALVRTILPCAIAGVKLRQRRDPSRRVSALGASAPLGVFPPLLPAGFWGLRLGVAPGGLSASGRGGLPTGSGISHIE